MVKAHEVAGDRIHSYPVIKDLFDTIDIRKDGIIDLSEWQQTFGLVTEGNSKLSIKATPTSTFFICLYRLYKDHKGTFFVDGYQVLSSC